MISFVETKLFTRLVQEYLSDDEYSKLQQTLLANPEAGGSHPRLRRCPQATLGRGWARQARRHPGHLFPSHAAGAIWMLTLYPKNVAENIPAQVLKQIKDEMNG